MFHVCFGSVGECVCVSRHQSLYHYQGHHAWLVSLHYVIFVTDGVLCAGVADTQKNCLLHKINPSHAIAQAHAFTIIKRTCTQKGPDLYGRMHFEISVV